jgi:beta-galactosidase
MLESHPYHFFGRFRLRSLASADPVPQGNPVHNDGKHAVVINEYGWHWVNRDGTPTALTRELYANVLGENATPAQRFHMQATWLAADTEFWRAHRNAAAVVHFTMLGYSRPDGQTCDHWKLGGVEKLEWEPEFYRYVRDAFAPVGVAVNFWKDKVIPQTQARIPVILINDLDQVWSGPVTLKLRQAGTATAIVEAKREARLEPFDQTTLDFEITWPESLGQYVLEAELRGTDLQPVRSVRELEIVDPSSLGLAYLKTATASSVHGAAYAAANAVDGDLATYWSSTFADPAWLAVDLGEVRKFGHVLIAWETAYSKAFVLQVSRDGQNWTDIHTEDNCQGGTSDIRFSPVEARHVRIYGTKRGTEWGHAIREFQVFE